MVHYDIICDVILENPEYRGANSVFIDPHLRYPHEFWKAIGKIGVSNNDKKNIPEEVVLEDGETSTDISEVLNKWKHHFSSLLNCTSELNPLTEYHFGGTAHTNIEVNNT